MQPVEQGIAEEAANWEFAIDNIPVAKDVASDKNVKSSQFLQPLFEFSGACAGCGETPYVKLATQLFGDRMLIANATGCSSIYGGSAPTCPYTKNADGHGPAWANSLFEDNAEFGYGMNLAMLQRRAALKDNVKAALESGAASGALADALTKWAADSNGGSRIKPGFSYHLSLLKSQVIGGTSGPGGTTGPPIEDKKRTTMAQTRGNTGVFHTCTRLDFQQGQRPRM